MLPQAYHAISVTAYDRGVPPILPTANSQQTGTSNQTRARFTPERFRSVARHYRQIGISQILAQATLLPAAWKTALVRKLEAEASPTEIDLAVPSWQKDAITVANRSLGLGAHLVVPPATPLGPEWHSWNPLNVHFMKGVDLDVDSNLVFLGRQIIAQSGSGTRSARDAAFVTGACSRIKAARRGGRIQLERPAMALGDTHHHYHFLLETIPRALHAREVFPEVLFLTHHTLSAVAETVIELLALDVRCVPSNTIVESAVVLVDHPDIFWPRKIDLDILREAFACWTSPSSKRDRVVYISRTHSSRSPTNEALLETELASRGVFIAKLEAMPIAEQVRLVAQSSVVIGPHGAGLANVAFMNPGSRVIEMSSGDRFEGCYRRICALNDLNYQFVTLPGDEENPAGRIDETVVSTVAGHLQT